MEGQPPFTIDQFLENNDRLAPTDLARVHQNIDNLTGRISYVKDKISFWSSQLQTLEGQLNQHFGVASALRGMPGDVLGHIFMLFPFARSDTLPSMGRFARKELVQLTLVCRTWRDTALATRQLWATVSFDGGDEDLMSYDKAAAWLARAGGVPRMLRIRLDRAGDCVDRCLLQSTPSSSCILNKSASLVRLIAEGPPLDGLDIWVRHKRCFDWFADALMKAHRHRQIPLKYVCLSIPPADERLSDFAFLSNFASLTGIYLMGTKCFGALGKVEGILERLTDLRLTIGEGGEPLHVTFAMLAKCVNLTELGVAIISIPHDRFKGTISIPKVTRLRVQVLLPSSSNRSPLESILDHLELPALIALENHSAYDSSATCAHFFERHPHIKWLVGRQGLAQVGAIFTKLPSLTHLALLGAGTAVEYFKGLPRPANSCEEEPLAPRLEWLELWEVELGSDLRPLLNGLLFQRQQGGLDGLKGITIEYMDRGEGIRLPVHVRTGVPSHADTVRLLRMDGVKVSENSYCVRNSRSSPQVGTARRFDTFPL